MSLSKLPLPATVTTTTVLSLNNYSNQAQTNQVKPITSNIKKQTLLHKSSSNPSKNTKTEQEKDDHHQFTTRRNVLLGLGTLYTTAPTFTNQDLIQSSIAGAPEKHTHNNHNRSSQTQPSISEFGSNPQLLDKKTIRFLVRRPKKLVTTKSKNSKSLPEVLIVDGIVIHHNGPVKFDVYVAKAHDDVVGSDLGQFAGSLVNLPFARVGEKNGEEVQGKGSLELGISGLVREIEAEDCEKVAVSLVPRLGEILVGGLRIETCKNLARDINDIISLAPFAQHGSLAPFTPRRTSTFA